ncbi:MAG: glycosyltransferase family 8 protein [Alphaproteobacteria bacterium]|nr:glycosyltransferase family 8 protein [Alphaproteobacteria bacterium]
MEKLAVFYFKIKRGLLHIIDLFIPTKVAKKNFVSWATFPRFNYTPNTTNYNKRINVAFCFNEKYIPLALTAITSLLGNSPECEYDIYCVTDITKTHQNKIKKFISARHTNGNIIFLKPNHDYDGAHCGRWSHAIWWRCMLPKMLPETVDRIIYADVDTLFVRDLRDANEFDIGTNLLAGCFDSPTYINSGFLVMNIAQFRQDNIYPKMIEWAENNQTRYPDQDMLNTICKNRIKSMSRKFNAIVGGGYSFLKTMNATQYRDMRYPVMLHYAGKIKPWDMTVKRFFTFDLYRKYYNAIIENY